MRLASSALALLALLGVAASAEEAVQFQRGAITIETATGATHRFDVELALTGRQRAQGLMFREFMPEDAGMLFLYPEERAVSMWMKNTLMPLDMLFVASDGSIVGIARGTPLSERSIVSPRPARAVVELNAGTADRLGIRAGDRVRHPFLEE